jgi:flagellin
LSVNSAGGISGSDLATGFSTPPNNSIQTIAVPSGPPGSATVTNIDVSAAQAANQTYTFTNSGNLLTLTRSSDGLSETITPPSIAAGGSATLDFATLGVKLSLQSTGGISSLNVAEGLSKAPNNTFTTTFTSTTVIKTTNTDVVDLQVGADAFDIIEIVLGEVSIKTLNLTTPLDTFNTSPTSANAETLISSLDSAIQAVSDRRTIFGVAQNRLDHAVANDMESASDTMAADSRIRDADIATELVNVTRAFLQESVSQAILAQANLNARSVLRILYPAHHR